MTKSHDEFYAKDNTACHVIARASEADAKAAAKEMGEVNVVNLDCSLPQKPNVDRPNMSRIFNTLHMKRFGIFKQLRNGTRKFVDLDEDESSARTEAIILKEQTGRDHSVFNLKTKRKAFDTCLHNRRLKKRNTLTGQKADHKLR